MCEAKFKSLLKKVWPKWGRIVELCGGSLERKKSLKDSRDAWRFFHDKPSLFPMLSSGNWPLCLYETVSGRNVRFSPGGDGMITPTPFRFMVKTEGLL